MGAIVKLQSNMPYLHLVASTQDSSAARFPNLHSGEYDLEVSSTGYRTTTEHASVLAGGADYTVYVYLQPEGEAPMPTGSKPLMTPKLQGEIDKALDKMRRKQFEAAQVHLTKAVKMAPGNPDIQYLLGMLEYSQQHYDLARVKFEAAIALYPTHERALVVLGELQLRGGDPALAVKTLEKAELVNGADWRLHFLLGYAYAGQKDYEKARKHAERAIQLNKQHSPPVLVLLGQILTAQNKTDEARRTFAAVIRDFPNEAAAHDAKNHLADLENPVALETPAGYSPPDSLAGTPAGISATAPLLQPWAPPDVDSKEYVLAPDVACSLPELLARAQVRTRKQIENFEKFLATEHVEHRQVDAYGNPGPPRTRDFNYLVFIHHMPNGAFYLEEERDGSGDLGSFPTSLATEGLVSLGVSLFDAEFERDVVYKCEGLGSWRGEPAWQIHFVQKTDVPSRLRTWKNQHGIFPVPLKGRAWIAANTYDIVHLETDLREPVRNLELARDHLIIDYGPVKFEHGATTLWLPWHAEMYMELHGKRYHHQHVLSNYSLFSVDSTHAISPPKQTLQDQP